MMIRLLLMVAVAWSISAATRFDNLVVTTAGAVANYTNFFNANSNNVSYATGIRSVATISDLVGSVNPLSIPEGGVVNVLGYSSAGDGGGGGFRRVLASSGTSNQGTFFASTVNPTYAWKRVDSGTISPEMFGGIPDDSISDQDAIQNASAYLNSIGGGRLVFREGVYLVSGLYPAEFVSLVGVAQQGQKNADEGSSIIKLINGASDAHVITVTNECQIINLQIDGNKANTTGTSYGIYFNRPGIYIESVVDGVSVVNTRSAGIYVNGNEVTIRFTSVIESDGYGIYVAGPAWDTIIQTVLLGWNGNDGLHFADGTAYARIENVDSYYSRGNGMTFINPFYVNFYRPQIDYSFKHGMEVVVTSSTAQMDVYAPVIHDSNYLDDGRGRTNSAASGTYSELCFSGNNYPSSLKFNNGRFAPLGTGTLKPLYNLCWSNTVPTVGYGVTIDNFIVETASGTRTASGKSAADGWLNGYWTGILQSYFDGTNAFTFHRDSRSSSRWTGVSPINAPTTMSGALSLGSTLSVASSVTSGGVVATRDLNSSKNGIKIQADTGETFGISNFGDSLYIASDSDSTPSLRFNGPAGTFSFSGAASFNSSVAAATTLSAGTAVTVGTTIELGNVSDTTISRSSAGTVAIEGNTVITSATIRSGTGTPEGAVTATVGTLFLRTDGGAGSTLYVKESGTGNTGWAAK